MATAFAMTLDTTPWERAIRELGRRGPVAVARALNRTGMSERTAMARAVAQDMGIKVSAAREAIAVVKATPSSLATRVVARGRPVPLIEFKAKGPVPSRGRGQGVSYVMQGQRKRVQSAFIATVGNGHRGVFVRRGRARLPIKQLYGPSVARVFGNLIPAGETRRNEVLLKHVQHEIEFELSRLQA